MGCIELLSNEYVKHNSNSEGKPIRIMIFTEGTVLGPKNIFQHFNHVAYIPIKNSVSLIKSWCQQGAEVVYLTSRRKKKDVNEIKELLLKYKLAGRYLYYREKGQKYKDIVEHVAPDILIEDDCRSIGGKWQMAITYVKPELKGKIKSIVVKEFSGIDSLPSKLYELLSF